MSTTIDQRVVEMQFDNRHFEKNVSTTMSSLEKLKKSLDLNGATKGLENIDYAAKKVDMTPIGSAVESLQLKFSALQVVGVTALANITNSAINAGKSILSSLTIAPVKTGFNEYELKMGSIQTIMASTGESLETVNRYLNELNEYSDKTIYSFSDMTQNIGKFTNAGVKLEDAVAAIQGISNVAAVSGANTNEASRAMYNFAQALSAGHVKLMDWKSIELANMATQEFKTYLLEAAVSAGTLTKTSDGMYETLEGSTLSATKNFNETLQEQWLTTEVLISTLKDYSDETTEIGKKAFASAQDIKTLSQLYDTLKESAQSGWAQTWELIVGDLEEAKDTLGGINKFISDILQASADARNNLLKGWKDAGGRADLVESLFNVIKAITSIAKPIKEAFRDIFPPMTVERLVGITKGLKDFTAKLKISEATSDKLKRTFKGLFAIFDIAKQVISAVYGAIRPLFGGLGDLSGGFLAVTAKIGDWLVGLSDSIRKSEVLTKAMNGLAEGVKLIGGAFAIAFDKVKEVFASIGIAISGVGNSIRSELRAIGSSLQGATFLGTLQSLWKGFKTIIAGIVKGIAAIGDGLANVFGNTNFAGLLDMVESLVASGIGVAVINFIKNLKDGIGGFSDIIDNAAEILDTMRGVLKAYQQDLQASALIKIAGAIAILVASLLVLSMIDSDKLYDAITAIMILFAGLMGSVKILDTSFKAILKLRFLTTYLIKIAAAVLILAIALRTIGDLGMEKIAAGVLGIAGLVAIMTIAVKVLGKSKKTVVKGAMQMVIFAAAIKVLASACADLGALSWGELARGLVGVAGLLAGVSLFLNTAKFQGKAISTAVGIVAIAAAVKILASACADFAWMSNESLFKGLSAVGVILGEIVIFSKLAGSSKGLVSIGIGMIAIAAAMKIFASAAQDVAKLSWGDLAKGLVGMAVALTTLGLTMKLMPKNLIGSGAGLIVVSSALIILAEALGRMSGMSWTEIGKGLVSLGGSLLILAAGLKMMNGSIAGSGALVIAAAAIAILAPTLMNLGSMSLSSIGKALLSVAGAFVVIGVAGLLLKPLVPTLLGLAAAFALVGAAVALIGVGLLAAGMGLTAIAAGITSLAASIAIGTSAIVGTVAAVITGLITGVADGIVAFCEIITRGAPAIGDAVKALVLTICDVLVECVPAIVDMILVLCVKLLDSLTEITPLLVDGLFHFVIGVLDSLARNIPELVKALVQFFADLFAGVGKALREMDFDISLDDILSVGALVGVMGMLAALAPLVPAAMAGVVGFGVLIAELGIVLAAVGALSQIPGLTWLVGEGGNLLGAIGTAIGKFVGGIMGGVAQGFTSSLPQIGSDLASFMTNVKPFVDGARLIDNSVVDGVMSLVGVILAITGASVIQGIASFLTGGADVVRFSEQLPVLGEGIRGFSDAIGDANPENIAAAANAAKALAKMTEAIPNEGGIASWFAGENSISAFADQLPSLGDGLKGFSDSVEGISPENIVAAATAAKALAEMTQVIPNEGGMVSWFTGENSISKFADDITNLGDGLKAFSDTVNGINPANVVAGAEAAKALAQMTTYIPNEGGMVAWFTGENSITRFASDIVQLGYGLKGFSFAVSGIVPEAVTAGAAAAKALAEMTSYIPNDGGMVAWFTGENSITRFADQLPVLGIGLRGFAMSVAGISAEHVTAAAGAAKTLAEMTSYIPNEGGVKAWFVGETSISKFGSELTALGMGLRGFAVSVTGINGEEVTAGANAAKVLAEMTAYIPNEGGVKAWFTGESSIATFASKLPALGRGLKGFSTSIEGINAENITAAANAAKALAEMTAVIPTEGGIKAWFTGETSVANFASKLPALGKGLKGFANEVGEINAESVGAASSAAKSLAEMTNIVPGDTSKLSKFGDNLAKFGEKLASYFSKTKGVNAETVTATNGIIDSVERVSNLQSGNIKSVANSIDDITKSLKNLSKIPKNSTSEFKKALSELGEASADELVKALEAIEDDTKKAGEDAMTAFVDGVESKTKTAKSACTDIAKACADAIGSKTSAFTTAGKNLVDGFANGISANSYKAAAKAKAMAEAAAKAAKDALDINSPSKVFRAIGTSIPEGFAAGIEKFTGMVKSSSVSMADAAVGVVGKSIASIADIVNSDIDAQPTIRPVLDLTDIQNGAKSIGGLFGNNSVGVLANVGAISSSMNGYNKHASNDDVVSAINKLRKDLANVRGDTYQIGDITYSEGDEVQGAVQALARAVKIGRRV